MVLNGYEQIKYIKVRQCGQLNYKNHVEWFRV